MSRLFRFVPLLLAGAGALVAVVRHISRRNPEHQQPFFADVRRAPAPAAAPEPMVTDAVVVPEPVVVEEPVAEAPGLTWESVVMPEMAAPVAEPMPDVEPEPVLFVEPAVEAVVEPEPVVAEEPVAAPEPALFEDEPVLEFRAAWSPAEEHAEEPFVAELPATPFMADEAADDEPAEAWFVADVQEPAPQPDPSPTGTDTWSGRAQGS